MVKYLVIGKNGNLGTELLNQLAGEALGIDKEELDITNEAEVKAKIAEIKPAIVFNCAAYNNSDEAESRKDFANLLNGLAPGCLAKACKEVEAVLVHFSSDYVFDGTKKEGYNEDDTPDPVNAYGESKLLGEKQIAEHTDKCYIVRTSWLFGKRGSSELSKPSFVDTMISLSKTKEELKVVCDEESRPTYIPDLAKATIDLVAEKKPFGIYHIVNEGTASWYELAEKTFELSKIPSPSIPVPGSEFPRAAKRPRYGYLNNTKLPKLRDWQEALEEYLGSE